MLGKDTPRPKYTISAHDGPVSALHVNPHVRGCIATGGMDKTVKIWNVQEEDDARREISMVTSQDLGVVSLLCQGLVAASDTDHFTGQSIHHPMVARLAAHFGSGWFIRQITDMGHGFQRRYSTSVWSEVASGRQGVARGEKECRHHRYCG
jgi:WD40 repeat protein